MLHNHDRLSSMLNVVVKGDDIRRAMAIIKEVDKTYLTALRKDMRNDISPYADKVRRAEPKAIDVPSGFLGPRHETRWTPSKASVSLTPGKRRKARAGESALISIMMNPVETGARGSYIMELAGTKSEGTSPQGTHLISFLKGRFMNPNPKGGRFFWNKFYDMKPEITALGQKSIDSFTEFISKDI